MNKKISTIDRAKEVLSIEANSILDLIDRIDRRFQDAVDILYKCKGRVVVTGVGKPGIIGRKFSATLASTGTPSLWMHPVEAVHGDMGMVVKNDVVVAISNSGETEELVRLIPLIKKAGAKLIALAGNSNSTLAKRSDIYLDVSVRKEACTLGLIPTSSTTAALAMCDALAVSLLEKKGFDLKDYAFYHPGGMIGKKLLQVKELMRGGKLHAIVKESTIIKDVLVAITEAKAGSATVVDKEGRVIGIFTDGDLRRHLEKDPMITKKSVSYVMTKNPIVVHMDTLAFEALRIIKDKKIDELVVVDGLGKPVGLIDEKDLLGIG
jgi:arabinose-5-phosphate isomerase